VLVKTLCLVVPSYLSIWWMTFLWIDVASIRRVLPSWNAIGSCFLLFLGNDVVHRVEIIKPKASVGKLSKFEHACLHRKYLMKNCVGQMVVIAVSTILWQSVCDYAVSVVSLLNSESMLLIWRRSISGLSFVHSAYKVAFSNSTLLWLVFTEVYGVERQESSAGSITKSMKVQTLACPRCKYQTTATCEKACRTTTCDHNYLLSPPKGVKVTSVYVALVCGSQ